MKGKLKVDNTKNEFNNTKTPKKIHRKIRKTLLIIIDIISIIISYYLTQIFLTSTFWNFNSGF